jgi:predicted dehydrogenase
MSGRVFHAPLISSVEGLELAAVVERSSDNAVQRYPGIATYRSLESMLEDTTLGLFVVATPSGTHFQVTRQILEADRNVVVDKPTAVTSAEIAELIRLAADRNVLIVPFHNRRWDSDFRTIHNLLLQETLGRLVHFESTLDRWNPGATRRPWKDDPAQGGGLLQDLGTHLADQALFLFGKPQSVGAEVRRERSGEGSNDSISLRLHYPGLSVVLGANNLSSLPRPRFHLRGTKGNYLKTGVDPQEAALNQLTRIADPAWGQEPAAHWGTLCTDETGAKVSRLLEPVAGDYRLYYAGVRNALLGKSPAPVAALDAWRVARILEWGAQSSAERREIPCDWTGEPPS